MTIKQPLHNGGRTVVTQKQNTTDCGVEELSSYPVSDIAEAVKVIPCGLYNSRCDGGGRGRAEALAGGHQLCETLQQFTTQLHVLCLEH